MSSLTRRSDPGPWPSSRVLRAGGHVARVRAWPGDPTTAQLVTLDLQLPPGVTVLRSWLEELRRDGFQRVRTGAVAALRTGPYDALGFRVAQQLVLLQLDLGGSRIPLAEPPSGAFRFRNAKPRELATLAELDAAAFPAGWSLDAQAISEAAEATARARTRVALDRHQRASAYSVTGRSGRAAFLQRLAVSPDRRGERLGAALVEDAIHWAHRWRCRTLAVNTQHDNAVALHLYHRAGFVERSHGLVVLDRSLAEER